MRNPERAETDATEALKALRDSLGSKLAAVERALADLDSTIDRRPIGTPSPSALVDDFDSLARTPGSRERETVINLRKAILRYFPGDGSPMHFHEIMGHVKAARVPGNPKSLSNRVILVLGRAPFKRISRGVYVLDAGTRGRRTSMPPAASGAPYRRDKSTSGEIRKRLLTYVQNNGPTVTFSEALTHLKRTGAPGKPDSLKARVSQILGVPPFERLHRGIYKLAGSDASAETTVADKTDALARAEET